MGSTRGALPSRRLKTCRSDLRIRGSGTPLQSGFKVERSDHLEHLSCDERMRSPPIQDGDLCDARDYESAEQDACGEPGWFDGDREVQDRKEVQTLDPTDRPQPQLDSRWDSPRANYRRRDRPTSAEGLRSTSPANPAAVLPRRPRWPLRPRFAR